MDLILGLFIIIGQIFGIVRLFGGATKSPYWLDCVTAIAMILCIVSLYGATLS